MSQEVANDFAKALRKLEEERDLEPLVGVHTDDCEVGNVTVSRTFEGQEGLREFWTSYRNTFGEMKSEFHNIFADGEGRAALEWTTTGTEEGKTVSYDGVSILEIDGDKVSRFMAYFNAADLGRQIKA